MWRPAAVIAAISLCFASPAPAQMSAESFVDLELVLAVDVSGSIDAGEAALQRAGYVQALSDPRIGDAIASGFLGRIAVTYVEWAGPQHQTQLVGWRVLDGPERARDFAAQLATLPVRTAQYTSISTIIGYASYLIENNTYQGTRRVIDISGDGPNNTGLLVTLARDKAVAEGLTINGLPILNGRPNRYGYPQLKDLDRYYVECVIGGPGAFIEIANGFETFADTVLRKLLLEIAARPVPPRPAIRPATGEGAYDCLIGERQLQQFFNDSGAL